MAPCSLSRSDARSCGEDWFELSSEQRRERATQELRVEILPQLADFEVTQHVFEKLIEEETIDPALRHALSRKSWCRWRKQNSRGQFARRCFRADHQRRGDRAGLQRVKRSALATSASARTGRRRDAKDR